MYATDASPYEIVPLAVVLPRTTQDVVRVVQYAEAHKVPVIPRGGGSGLAGQAIGQGIVLDFSRYMNRIIEIDAHANFVIVEAGVYKAVLDQALGAVDRFLPPDPSSAYACTLGGMISTNAAGPHTVKYGSTKEYVLSLTVVLANGEVLSTRPLSLASEDWQHAVTGDTRAALLHRELARLLESRQEFVRERLPHATKNSAGYRLEHVLQEEQFDLGQLFAGAEGTLGIVVQAKLRVVPRPTCKAVAMLHFDSLGGAGDAVRSILPFHPSALELIDRYVVGLAAAAHPELQEQVPPDTSAILLVELDGENRTEIADRMRRLEGVLVQEQKVAARCIWSDDSEEMERLWDVRRKALPFVHKIRMQGRRLSEFVEDAAVDPKQLGVYLRRLERLFKRYDMVGVYFGHAGDGHIHAHPVLDLKDPKELRALEQLAEEMFDLVRELNGTTTGEHGDGLARTGFLRRLYGDELYELFRHVKQLCDPAGILNPGKKVTEQPSALTDHLRFGGDYRRRQLATQLRWQVEGSRLIQKITTYQSELDFASEVELCHGCGYCRGGAVAHHGRMCPVYKAFGQEMDGCRGRNNLLRWMVKLGGLGEQVEFTDEYREAIYKHCIQCKMCYVDCPSNVNVGKIMAEARARYAAVRGLPKGYRYFMDLDRYADLGAGLAPLSNWLMAIPAFRYLLEWTTSIDHRRPLPPFHRRTFAKQFAEYERTTGPTTGREVVLFYDTYLNYNDPQLGFGIVHLLERNGYRVRVPPQRSSGLPALLEGAPGLGRAIAQYNVEQLAPYARRGIPILTFSPSAGVALRLDYLYVLESPEALAVANSVYNIHEFLYELYQRGQLAAVTRRTPRDVLLHVHCHDLVQGLEPAIQGLLETIPGVTAETLERGCCGIGGSFGFIKDNYDISMAIGRDLFDAVEAAKKPVYSTGESCALQMTAGSGRRVGLTVQLLAEAYGV